MASAQVLVLGSPLDGVREQNTRWRGAVAAGGSGAYLAFWSQREQLFGVTISAAGVDLLRAVELDEQEVAGGQCQMVVAKVRGERTGKEGDNEARHGRSLCSMASNGPNRVSGSLIAMFRVRRWWVSSSGFPQKRVPRNSKTEKIQRDPIRLTATWSGELWR